MAIRNIIQKAEQEFPPAIKQELDPLARPELALLSGYVNSTFYTKDNPSGFINITNPVLKGAQDVIYVDGAGTTGVNGVYVKTSTSPLTYTKYDSSSYRIILNTNVGPGFAWNIQELIPGGAGWQERYRGGNSNLGHTSPLDFPEWYVGLGIYPGQAPAPRLYSYISTFDQYYKPFQEFAFINGANNKLRFGITGGWFSSQSYTLSHRPQNGIIALLSDFSGVVFTTGNQTISGFKTFVNNTNFTNDISVSGFYNFNTTNTGEPLDGQMSWHPDYGTVQIGMNGGQVVNPVGFKSFYRVKAASTIRKGKVVMALGGVGNSEYILAREAQNIGNSGQLIMGVSVEEITQNNYGDVVAFGAVRGINTDGLPVDSILYYDPLSTGGLTHIPPQAPLPKVTVAINTTSSNNGIIFVRVSAGSELGGTDSNVKFNSLQDKDVVKYNAASGLWVNSQLNTGDISGISNFITSQNVVFTTGSQIISGNKTFQANEYNFDGANISIYGGGTFEVNASVETKGIPKDLGGVSGLQVMTTGAYNSGIPLSGVVYILI